jgi:hypothetical protein
MLRRNCHLFRSILFSCLICFGLAASATEPAHGTNSVQGTVLKVLPSPSIWSGTIESLQWFDLRVVKSSFSSIKKNAVLHIGVPLVRGNHLFDQRRREFSKSKVAPGKLLALTLSANCSKSQDPDHYTVEPKCIRALK